MSVKSSQKAIGPGEYEPISAHNFASFWTCFRNLDQKTPQSMTVANMFSDDFLYMFSTMEELCAFWPRLTPSGMNISTMTIIGRTREPTHVNLSAIHGIRDNDMKPLLNAGQIHETCPESDLHLVVDKKRKQKVGQFGNQITLGFHSRSVRSIKIFRNGELHLTGAKNVGEFHRLSRIIGGLLFAVGAVDIRLEFEEPNVRMLNMNFSLGCELSLLNLLNKAREVLKVPVTHETEDHPALMIKFPFATAMVFKSGQVLVTSREYLAGLLAAYRMVCQLVNDNIDAVHARVSLKRKRTSTASREIIDGYPIGQALPCYKPVRQPVHIPERSLA